MSRNNDVFQVLVTKGNQAVLAKDKKVTELLPGQIGAFDFGTNMSVDATTTNMPKNFYLAVGLDTDGNGTTTDIAKSSGSNIQGKNVVHYSFRPHTPGRPMKVLLKDYQPQCETEYGVKLELRNQEIYATQGFVQFTKSYFMKTGCCNCAEPCAISDANEITRDLFINVSNDSSGMVKANIKARTAITAATVGGSVATDIAIGGSVTFEQLEDIIAYNSTETDPADFFLTDLEFETIPQKVKDFCTVNLGYFYPRQTVAILTKVEGFKCTGKIEVTQNVAFEEGAGIDLKQKEYMALGWKDSPYRLSTLNGMAFDRSFNVDATTKYDQFHLTYDQYSIGAWLEYYNNLATTIGVPATDTITRNGLAALLDKLLLKFSFEPLADDAATANVNPAIVEKTEDKAAATDGISS